MTTQSQNSLHADEADLDPNSLAAIRNLLATEPVVTPQPVKERLEAKAEAAIVPMPESGGNARAPRAEPVGSGSEKSKTKIKADTSLMAKAKAKVMGYRPTAKHIVFGGLGWLIFFRPWLVLGLLVLTSFVVVGVFLILGYDGFWRRAMGTARWYARRRPDRTDEMHRKLDIFAMKWDAVLDRFPEGSVDGLYLPDFGDLAQADARHEAALDRRFDSLRKNEA